MIPKTIHFVWLSGEPYPPLIRVCLNSWKRHLPEFSIKLWNSECLEDISVPFVREAFALRQWAFCADVIRLHALFTQGGVYLDSDVLFRAPLPYEVLEHLVFSAVEYHHGPARCSVLSTVIDSEGHRLDKSKGVPGIGIQAAIIGSIPGHPFIARLLEFYRHSHFVDHLGTLSDKLIAPGIYASIAEEWGFCYHDKLQYLNEGVVVYPSSLFSSSLALESSEAVAVHCCAGSWRSPRTSIFRRIAKRVRRAGLRFHIFSS